MDNSVGASYEGTRVLEDHSDNHSPTYHWINFIDHLMLKNCLFIMILFGVRRRNWEASSWCTQSSRQSSRALPAESALNPAQPKQPRGNIVYMALGTVRNEFLKSASIAIGLCMNIFNSVRWRYHANFLINCIWGIYKLLPFQSAKIDEILENSKCTIPIFTYNPLEPK